MEIKPCNPATQNIVLQTSIDREWKNTRGQHLALHCVPWRQHFQFCISKTWNVWRSFCVRRHCAVRKWSVEEEQQLSDAWPTHPHTHAREHTHTRTHVSRAPGPSPPIQGRKMSQATHRRPLPSHRPLYHFLLSLQIHHSVGGFCLSSKLKGKCIRDTVMHSRD